MICILKLISNTVNTMDHGNLCVVKTQKIFSCGGPLTEITIDGELLPKVQQGTKSTNVSICIDDILTLRRGIVGIIVIIYTLDRTRRSSTCS